MKIGLYFGTFNPIHVGHLTIANHLAEQSDLDQVWFVVTPLSPFKNKNKLLDNHQRLEMVYRATKDYTKLKPCDIEFGLKQPNFTIDTLTYLFEKFPEHEFALIMGEDNLKSFHKWKNYKILVKLLKIVVFSRKDYDIKAKKSVIISKVKKIIFIKNKPINISSTQIKKKLI